MGVNAKTLGGFGEKTETRFSEIMFDPWIRSMIAYDEHTANLDPKAVVIAVLTKHYLDIVEEPEREELERRCYELRDKGLNWVAVSRHVGMPYEPIKVQLLAMCYAYRPVLAGRQALPWPI